MEPRRTFDDGRPRARVTGLGRGCVVRGLLARPQVEHIDVVEIDVGVLDMVGPSFAGEPRLMIHQGDALTYTWPQGARFTETGAV